MHGFYDWYIKSFVNLGSEKLNMRPYNITPEICFSLPDMFFDLCLRKNGSLVSHEKFEELIELARENDILLSSGHLFCFCIEYEIFDSELRTIIEIVMLTSDMSIDTSK
jgi:hypothetical protein